MNGIFQNGVGITACNEPFVVWTVDAMTRIGLTEMPGDNDTVIIKAARGEYESFQIIISAISETNGINITISDFVGESDRISKEHVTFYREMYISITESTPESPLSPGLYPDILLPFVDPLTKKDLHGMYDASPFSVPAGCNQPIWVDVYIPYNISPGEYYATITVKANNNFSATLPVHLTVWDFELPPGPIVRGNFYLSWSDLEKEYDLDWSDPDYEEKYFPLVRRYIDSMLAHRLPPDSPDDAEPIVDEDTGKINYDEVVPGLGTTIGENLEYYIETWNLPTMCAGIYVDWPWENPLHSDREKALRYLRSIYEYFSDHGWENKLYVWTIDEPNNLSAYQAVRKWSELVHEANADLKFLVTEQPTPDNPAWGSLVGYVDIWVPIAAEQQLDREAIEERLANGEEVWSYVALVQPPSPVWAIDYPPLHYRVMPWLNFLNDITGLLYWCVNYWSEVEDPWVDPATWKHWGETYNGEGSLYYPGTEEKIGYDGPVPSMRLKWLREGMEDWGYLLKLQKDGKEDFAKKLVKELITDWETWEQSVDKWYKIREKLAEGIETTKDIISPEIMPKKPLEGYLYINDREIIPLYLSTIIFGSITVEIDAWDNETGINRIEFYVDNVLKATDDKPPYQWIWDEEVFGLHEIKAIAYDNAGNSANSTMNVIIFNV